MCKIVRLCLRLFAWLAALFIGITLAALLAVYFFFDPNQYKSEISLLLREQTGLPISIKGNIALTLLPWVGLRAEQVSIPPTMEFQRLDIQLPFRHLLREYLTQRTIATTPITAHFISTSPIAAEGTVEGVIGLKQSPRTVNITAHIRFDMPSSSGKQGVLKTTLTGDLNSQLILKDLDFQSGNTHVHGTLTWPFAKDRPVTFSLSSDVLDLNTLMATTTPDASAFLSTATVPSAPTAGSSPPSPPRTMKMTDRVLSGTLKLGRLHYRQYTLYNVNTIIQKKGALLSLAPFTATLWEGQLKADITHTPTTTTLRGVLRDFQVTDLLKTSHQPLLLSGTGTVDFHVSKYKMVPLTGTIKCDLRQGIIIGIDIPYYLAVAQSLLKKSHQDRPNTQQTAFNRLLGTFKIHDNLIDNNDLTLLHDKFKAQADGNVNLQQQTLTYKLRAHKIYSDGQEHRHAYPLAIRIKGPLQHPTIEPDIDVYLKKFVDVELHKQLDKKLDKQVNKWLEKLKEL